MAHLVRSLLVGICIQPRQAQTASSLSLSLAAPQYAVWRFTLQEEKKRGSCARIYGGDEEGKGGVSMGFGGLAGWLALEDAEVGTK